MQTNGIPKMKRAKGETKCVCLAGEGEGRRREGAEENRKRRWPKGKWEKRKVERKKRRGVRPLL